jgi:tryptophanyl-tRNA synthetase
MKKFVNSSGQQIRHYSDHKISFPQRIFSGIQPTGTLHLGNYFGAVQTWSALQNKGEDVIFCIVDLHSITIKQKHKDLKENIQLMAASLLACGIDPQKSILFQQSQVPEHTQLAWVLTCLCTVNRLNHMPTYVEKCAELKQSPTGLFLYPVLQAADILLYKATHIPAGLDQIHNINLANHLTQLFNNKFDKIFPIPQLLPQDESAGKVKSLKDPSKKMSKSDLDSNSKIEITDPPEVIVRKCKKALTDCTSAVTYDPENRPAVSNLITLHALCTNQLPQDICTQVKHLNTGQYKLLLADVLVEKFKPIRDEIEYLMKSKEHLEKVLLDGSIRAQAIAVETWDEVKSKIGF